MMLFSVVSSMYLVVFFFFFQAEDGIRDLVRSRGLGDVYKRQGMLVIWDKLYGTWQEPIKGVKANFGISHDPDTYSCLLYTSDAADERSSVDLGGRRIIKKKNKNEKSVSLISDSRHDKIQ